MAPQEPASYARLETAAARTRAAPDRATASQWLLWARKVKQTSLKARLPKMSQCFREHGNAMRPEWQKHGAPGKRNNTTRNSERFGLVPETRPRFGHKDKWGTLQPSRLTAELRWRWPGNLEGIETASPLRPTPTRFAAAPRAATTVSLACLKPFNRNALWLRMSSTVSSNSPAKSCTIRIRNLRPATGLSEQLDSVWSALSPTIHDAWGPMLFHFCSRHGPKHWARGEAPTPPARPRRPPAQRRAPVPSPSTRAPPPPTQWEARLWAFPCPMPSPGGAVPPPKPPKPPTNEQTNRRCSCFGFGRGVSS
jgi:hypothetical protein